MPTVKGNVIYVAWGSSHYHVSRHAIANDNFLWRLWRGDTLLQEIVAHGSFSVQFMEP